MIPHRGPEMHDLLARIARGLPPLFGTARPVYIATCAATGLMEAAIRCGARRRVLSLVNGAFGERFAAMAEACGRTVTRLTAEPGAVVEPERVAAALDTGDYDAVTMVHVETSTGALADVAAVGRLLTRHPEAMLLVDAVTSVGGMPVEMDAWGADVVLAASQKALALPPGLAFAACTPRLLERARSLPARGIYLDLVRMDDFWHRGETATTPAISLLYALEVQLAAIALEGLSARFERHREMARSVWKWARTRRAAGDAISLLAPEGARAPTVSAVACADAPRVVALARERGVVLGAGYGALASTTFRIGHMGDHTVAELIDALAVVGEVLDG